MGKRKKAIKAAKLLREMRCSFVPDYRGADWISPRLPDRCELWLPGKGGSHSIAKDLSHHRALSVELQRVVQQSQWKWPGRTICFVSDLHADTDAFFASLVASGGICKTGRRDKDFELTKLGRKALFLIGGDCFDKGPSNLRLLRAIRKLMKRGARVRILAGNHDIRMMQGIHSVSLEDDPRTDHFFVRMGPKMVPFLKEIWDEYLDGKRGLRGVPDLQECRRRLYPRKRWFSDFPRLASWVMPDKTIEREMKKLRVKMESFERDCERSGLSLRMVYAAVKQWERLFIAKKGEFSWFFKQMRLAYRDGSFLFLHAGLDDRIARIVRDEGVDYLNREFGRQMFADPFDFYYGPLANTLRTKYRDVDMPLTPRGVSMIKKRGIYVLVHGHHNRLHGQRIMLREGIINFECDATLDRNSRKKEGLRGIGAAATIFTRQHQVLGISTDYPAVKLFDPKVLAAN